MSAIGSRVGDVPIDEDTVQDAVIRYWEQLVEGQSIRSAPAWARTAAANLARSQFRRRQAEARALERLGRERSQPPGLEDDPRADALRLRIAQLPPRQREIVVLFYYAELSIAEVAEEARCCVGTVKATLHQARRALRGALQPENVTATDTEGNAMALAHWGITGTHRHEYELDRAEEQFEDATIVLIGAILSGSGSLAVANLHVEIVGPEVSITESRGSRAGLLKRPTNPRCTCPVTWCRSA